MGSWNWSGFFPNFFFLSFWQMAWLHGTAWKIKSDECHLYLVAVPFPTAGLVSLLGLHRPSKQSISFIWASPLLSSKVLKLGSCCGMHHDRCTLHVTLPSINPTPPPPHTHFLVPTKQIPSWWVPFLFLFYYLRCFHFHPPHVAYLDSIDRVTRVLNPLLDRPLDAALYLSKDCHESL
jgi:hypothetical protein